MKTRKVIIPEIHERGFAFAYDEETGDQVYMPARVLEVNGLGELDEVEVRVVPNDMMKSDVPWRAVGVLSRMPAPTPPTSISIEDRISARIKNDPEGIWSHAEIVEEFGGEADAGLDLLRLERRLAVAVIVGTDNSNPKYFYTANVETFEEIMTEEVDLINEAAS